MMNRKGAAIFTGAALCAMAVPMIGTLLGARSGQAGNEQTAAFPRIMTEGKVNGHILSDIGDWYDEHHALRTQMIDADARGLLLAGDSANEEVIVGKDGWEYYADEEGDLYGTSRMSDRALFDLSRSMKMMQDALEKKGTQFVFAVAPNKSTMVPEYLPDYVKAAAAAGGGSSNLDGLAGMMQQQGVHYLDLRQTLEKAAKDNGLTQAQMWLKTDSHWNSLGAKACADAIMAALAGDNVPVTEDYSGWTQTASIDGDLQAMLLPVTAEAEADWEAPSSQKPVFTVDGEITSYFDPRIYASGSGTGTLIAWRDSFCNSMLPYLAGESGTSYFTRSVPCYLSQADDMDADLALVECAQRMLSGRAQEPPAFDAPSVIPSSEAATLSQETIGAENSWNGRICAQREGAWVTITGWIRPEESGAHDRILIAFDGNTFEACPAVVVKEDGETSDWGFRARIPLETFDRGEWPEGASFTVMSEPAAWEESQAVQQDYEALMTQDEDTAPGEQTQEPEELPGDGPKG